MGAVCKETSFEFNHWEKTGSVEGHDEMTYIQLTMDRRKHAEPEKEWDNLGQEGETEEVGVTMTKQVLTRQWQEENRERTQWGLVCCRCTWLYLTATCVNVCVSYFFVLTELTGNPIMDSAIQGFKLRSCLFPLQSAKTLTSNQARSPFCPFI